MHQLLAHLQIPACVEDVFGVLASNPVAVALSPGENRLRSLLLNPGEQAVQQERGKATADFIAALRATIEDDAGNRRGVERVGELALSSQRFRDLRAQGPADRYPVPR
ncbi:hypothetical protein [Streptomyces sp. NBC_01013]|uniref:MmyB family transcriptional regulator n=1 Tax=Streptomyces sp. NBC_01013 TaxID=2903718 RepID=UPI00386C8880